MGESGSGAREEGSSEEACKRADGRDGSKGFKGQRVHLTTPHSGGKHSLAGCVSVLHTAQQIYWQTFRLATSCCGALRGTVAALCQETMKDNRMFRLSLLSLSR